jgi:protein SCO1/2
MAIEMLRLIRYGAIALIAVLALVWAGVGLGVFTSHEPAPLSQSVVAPFQLVDQDGLAVTEKDVLGKPAAIFFGYTYCPDVCPSTLASLTALLDKLGPDADGLRVIFVTVDPARDTPSTLKAYLSAFDPRIRGLTGPADQIAAIAKPLGVYYARVEGDGSYTMDHTASVFLLDAQGGFRGTIAVGEGDDAALAKLRRLVR